MSLAVAIRHRLGAFELDARFESEGRLTALFGRSGSGKTSLVNVIAGLIHPDHGKVTIDGETLVDTEQRLDIPAYRRRVGYVFQEARLFPHLSVRQNLLYGQWFTARARRYETLDRVVELLGLAALLDRRPARLSGGEKQRVAIGRALLTSPRLLLMDEPLASLDEARKGEIMPYLERLRDEVRVPIIYVSHSVPEVTRLATTMVLLDGGKVAGVGPVADVMGRIDLFPAIGRPEAGAVLEMTVVAHDPAYELTTLRSAAGELRVPQIDVAVGRPIRVQIRARDIIIGLRRPEELSALNVLSGRIAEIVGHGPVTDLRLDLNGQILIARVTRLTVDRLGLTPGRPVFAIIKSLSVDRRQLGQVGPPAGDAVDEITL